MSQVHTRCVQLQELARRYSCWSSCKTGEQEHCREGETVPQTYRHEGSTGALSTVKLKTLEIKYTWRLCGD